MASKLKTADSVDSVAKVDQKNNKNDSNQSLSKLIELLIKLLFNTLFGNSAKEESESKKHQSYKPKTTYSILAELLQKDAVTPRFVYREAPASSTPRAEVSLPVEVNTPTAESTLADSPVTSEVTAVTAESNTQTTPTTSLFHALSTPTTELDSYAPTTSDADLENTSQATGNITPVTSEANFANQNSTPTCRP